MVKLFAAQLLSRLIYETLTYKMLMPEILNIQMTSQMAIAATTTYRIHCPTVFGSVRFSMLLLYLRFPPEMRRLFVMLRRQGVT